jgi:hypothetical protein
MIQCWTSLINYGVRSGGGIGDQLPKVAFHSSSQYSGLFFFNLTFHIFVILILGNVFLGIIVDSFGDLRDRKLVFENDFQNVCFICQTTRDKLTIKGKDFDDHVDNEHYIWNYVYFMTYLLVNNPYDFNYTEHQVYDNLKDSDISWIPIEY